jgi:hypothetical protein
MLSESEHDTLLMEVESRSFGFDYLAGLMKDA